MTHKSVVYQENVSKCFTKCILVYLFAPSQFVKVSHRAVLQTQETNMLIPVKGYQSYSSVSQWEASKPESFYANRFQFAFSLNSTQLFQVRSAKARLNLYKQWSGHKGIESWKIISSSPSQPNMPIQHKTPDSRLKTQLCFERGDRAAAEETHVLVEKWHFWEYTSTSN